MTLFIKGVLDSLYNGIIATDLVGNITIFNKSAEKYTGWSVEEAYGRNVEEVIPQIRLSDVLQTGEPSLGQKIEINGFKLIINSTPIFSNGNISGAVSIFQDVSPFESSSEEVQSLKNLTKELEAIIESCNDAIVVASRDGTLERINTAYERITGIKVKDILGRNMRELEDQGVVSQSVTLLTMQKRKPVTIIQKLHTGREIIVTGTPVFNEQGEIVKVVTTGRDMTELNNIKAELEKFKELSNKYFHKLETLRAKMKDVQDVIFSSEKMCQVMDLVLKIAQVDSTVLLLGESGVGKEVLARVIHSSSHRKDGPFVRINCGAIPEQLLESELFGYDEGAFTGAKRGGKPGLFETANKGTIFLDEISELPLALQVKLLRVLQEQEITRVGSCKPLKVDVRIIAASNRDLSQMVRQQRFREDLYYRLNVVPIMIPPLRERKEDIIPLAMHFLKKYNQKFRLNKTFSAQFMDTLLNYHWPGNVRELENIIERLVVVSYDDVISDLSLAFPSAHKAEEEDSPIAVKKLIPLKKAIELVEQLLIDQALREYGSTREAAKVLQINQSTVVRKKNMQKSNQKLLKLERS